MILASLLVLSLLPSCSRRDVPKEINVNNRVEIPSAELKDRAHVLRVAVGAMITPKEGFGYYRRLLDYIGRKVEMTVDYIDRKQYAEVNALLKSGQVDAAFVCSGPYVTGHKEFGLELLLAPQAYGAPVYYSYIIVNRDSNIHKLEELRGHTFAFSDPDSNSGKLSPTYILSQMGETPDTFFSSYEFTYAHDKSIEVVARHLVDGAAVDSLVWEYLARTRPDLTDRTRIIARSEPYGMPPLVVRPGLPSSVKGALKSVLLHMNEEPEGREILKGMMVERFVETDDHAYDSIRMMQARVAAEEAKK